MTRSARPRSPAGSIGIFVGLLAICGGLVAVAENAVAGARTGSASSLLAVEQVATRVDPVDASLGEAGVTREMLRLRLLSLLRDAEVNSVDAGEGLRDHTLSLQATYVLNSGWHVVSLSLYFTRAAALAADPSTTITATVWSRSTLIVARKKKVLGEVETALANLVTEFSEDYKVANPR